MTHQRFPPLYRIRQTGDYQRVYAARQRFSDPRMLVYAVWSGQAFPRIGVSVSRKHGGAVQRHRLKRLIREAFRLSRAELPAGLDLVVIPQGGIVASVEEYRWSLERLSRKASQRLKPVTVEPPVAE